MGVIGQAHQPGFYPVSSVDGILAGQPLHYYRQLGSYTAYWEVQQSHLYLHHLEVCVYDKQKKEEYSLTYQPDQIEKVVHLITKTGKSVPAGSTENFVPGKVSWCVMYTAASTAI